MRRIMTLALILASSTALAACETTNGTSSNGYSSNNYQSRGYKMQVDYATVTRVGTIRRQSAAPAGAVVGGIAGLLLTRKGSTGGAIAGTAGGAVLGGLATRGLEGDLNSYQYSLALMDGGEINFVTEKNYLVVGDCVSVERGDYANVRRVASSLCGRARTADIAPSHVRDANECHVAKQQLLEAQTEEAARTARTKVDVLCN
ncbi:hypothetical protein N9M10_00655 [Hellea sp.]|nr:hypothetical protein [Hellea sp.]